MVSAIRLCVEYKKSVNQERNTLGYYYKLFYTQLFFQSSLSDAQLFHDLSFKCCLGAAEYI